MNKLSRKRTRAFLRWFSIFATLVGVLLGNQNIFLAGLVAIFWVFVLSDTSPKKRPKYKK